MRISSGFGKIALVMACAVLLAGCEMAVPSRVNTAKIEVRSKMETHVLSATTPSESEISAIANDVRRRGEGPVKLLMVYDPVCCTSVEASQKGTVIKNKFMAQGVKNVTMGLIPARDGMAKDQAIVTYHALVANAPESCDQPIPGSDGAVSSVSLYQYGCQSADIMSKQIARPGDLLGRDPAETEGTARRQGAVVEPYNTGAPNEPLEGVQASGLGEGN